ncbi:hypothetical protein SISSUDRAFT_1061454 [Sistotremastrum suecicum HHB10207 ss-3]|uniref:Smr domain-containing protein n=1 Tax=Sistotremastrum suecicum HHB10207 ss-3 TaxID=1314776 RepID=A0A166DZC2_9AGAM|nr:hypothetical protein SISSUDRAFT_1061454 [Sistotremastrum suecicum HHB10207 ss-3]
MTWWSTSIRSTSRHIPSSTSIPGQISGPPTRFIKKTLPSSILEWRHRANEEGELVAKFLEEAREEFRNGRKGMASNLKDQARERRELQDAHNERAACAIFNFYNPYYSIDADVIPVDFDPDSPNVSLQPSLSPSTPTDVADTLREVDLHGLFVSEALFYSRRHLHLCLSHSIGSTQFITGRGSNRTGKIKPAIKEWLLDEQRRRREAGDRGRFFVRDESMDWQFGGLKYLTRQGEPNAELDATITVLL